MNLNQAEPGDTSTAGRWKVSAKIQQLLNTLKRPKRRPLPEFYEDNDIELEIAANPKDPNAPRPEGATMTTITGEQLVITTGLPRSLEAALQRYGTSSFKAPNGDRSRPKWKADDYIDLREAAIAVAEDRSRADHEDIQQRPGASAAEAGRPRCPRLSQL